MSKKKIGIVGARGIANYGGFETFVSELAPRLVRKNFDVYCSCEKDDEMVPEYKQAKLVYFPFKMPENYQLRKFLEFFYDLYFGFIFSFKCDVVYFLGFSANIFTFFPRLLGKKSYVNMAGVEWERSKFSKRERSLLKLFFKLSVIGSNNVIIDNNKLINYFDEKYHKKALYITYGVDFIPKIEWNQDTINSYSDSEVLPHEYWLAVARLQPDNNIETILDAYMESNSEKPLIIIGGFSTDDDYEKTLKSSLNRNNDKEIIFTGGIYDQDDLNMFRQNCFGYIHAHSIGGTNPSLLEAMVMKNIIIAHDNEFNRDVAKDAALYFKDDYDLRDKIELVEKKSTEFSYLKKNSFENAKSNFNWEKITNKYSELFRESLGK